MIYNARFGRCDRESESMLNRGGYPVMRDAVIELIALLWCSSLRRTMAVSRKAVDLQTVKTSLKERSGISRQVGTEKVLGAGGSVKPFAF